MLLKQTWILYLQISSQCASQPLFISVTAPCNLWMRSIIRSECHWGKILRACWHLSSLGLIWSKPVCAHFSPGGRLLGQVMQHSDPAEGGPEPHPVSDTLQCHQSATVGVFYARVAGGHSHRGARPPAQRVPGSAQVHPQPHSVCMVVLL